MASGLPHNLGPVIGYAMQMIGRYGDNNQQLMARLQAVREFATYSIDDFREAIKQARANREATRRANLDPNAKLCTAFGRACPQSSTLGIRVVYEGKDANGHRVSGSIVINASGKTTAEAVLAKALELVEGGIPSRGGRSANMVKIDNVYIVTVSRQPLGGAIFSM